MEIQSTIIGVSHNFKDLVLHDGASFVLILDILLSQLVASFAHLFRKGLRPILVNFVHFKVEHAFRLCNRPPACPFFLFVFIILCFSIINLLY